MPANSVQWTWFLFFALGALGGLTYLVNLVLGIIGNEAWKTFRK